MLKTITPVISAVILLLAGSLVWGFEKAKILDLTKGSNPAIATDGAGNLYIAYESPVTYEVAKAIRDDNGHLHSIEGGSLVLSGIWFSQSSAGSDKWSTPVNIPGLSGASTQCDLAIEKNGAIDIVWAGTNSEKDPADIFFARSIDSGKNWTKPKSIANTPGQSSQPGIAITPDSVLHVVWTDTSRGPDKSDIFYSSSPDNGVTWGKNALLPAEDISNTAGQSKDPTIAIGSDGTIHVAWVDSTPGETRPDIFYAYKANGKWSAPINISQSPKRSSSPGIACGPKGKVYISWADNSKKENITDIWCAVSTKLGEFAKAINISNTPGLSSEPTIAADDTGHIAVVWSDTSNKQDKPDVYCRISTDNSAHFSNVIDLSHAMTINKHPDVIIVGNKMLATWEESTASGKKVKVAALKLENSGSGSLSDVDSQH